MEFDLDGRKFRVKKLSAFDQLHLSRKVAPLLPPLAPLIMKISENAKKEDEEAKRSGNEPRGLVLTDILTFAQLAEPFAEALADMKDQHAEQIFTLTLSSVELQTNVMPPVWVPLWMAGSKMASEIELNDAGKLLPIVVRVIIHNLGNFTAALLTSREEVTPESNGGDFPVRKTG